MLLRMWVYVASIQVGTVRINTVMTSCYSIRIENRKDIKDQFISDDISHLCIFGDLINNTSHDMRARNFTGMNSSPNNKTFLIFIKGFRLRVINKKVLIINLLGFMKYSFLRTYR